MGCGASTAAAPPGGGSAPTGKPGKVPDNGLPKGIVPDKSGKGKYDMKALFAQFDADGDGKLDIYEIARAFRAIGLTKRSGEKSDMDKAMLCVHWRRARSQTPRNGCLGDHIRSPLTPRAPPPPAETHDVCSLPNLRWGAHLSPPSRSGLPVLRPQQVV
jgi:hypothetical protein